MDKEALKEKLAEWAGFEKGYCGVYPSVFEFWFAPSREKYEELPNFPESLDACFKWLEPELYRRGYRYQLRRLQDGHLIEICRPRENYWAEWIVSVLDKEASMAFSLAIEKLIDGESDARK